MRRVAAAEEDSDENDPVDEARRSEAEAEERRRKRAAKEAAAKAAAAARPQWGVRQSPAAAKAAKVGSLGRRRVCSVQLASPSACGEATALWLRHVLLHYADRHG